MGKRPRFSRWRRLPGVFRSGEHRPPDTGTELDRIILYVPPRILDLAEALAEKAGVSSVQDYCALVLMQGLENQRVQQRVAEFESRRGPLEGLKQIADDPQYLAEWQQRSDARAETAPNSAFNDELGGSNALGPGEPVAVDILFPESEPSALDSPAERVASELSREKPALEPPHVRVESSSGFVPIVTLRPTVQLMSERSPSEILSRHVASGEDEWGFLPCLRRGEPVPAAKAAELNRALSRLEEELRGADVLNRRTAHALYRLALESQVLLTDAWPGAFDERVIAAIRSVQEAVERILSGQDIHDDPTPLDPDPERPN
ncbi:MAG TPA: hypothetical protein VKA15_26740 [Isosphaeraceae bacterium]|nr:hypothetical protein [Isosphaeraceae bacterium]